MYIRRVFVLDFVPLINVAAAGVVDHWADLRASKLGVTSETLEFDGTGNSTYVWSKVKNPATTDATLLKTLGLHVEIEFAIKYTGAAVGTGRVILGDTVTPGGDMISGAGADAFWVEQDASNTYLKRVVNGGAATTITTIAFAPTLNTIYYFRVTVNLATGAWVVFRDTTWPATTSRGSGTDASIPNLDYYFGLDDESSKVQFSQINVHTVREGRFKEAEGWVPTGSRTAVVSFTMVRSASGSLPAHLRIDDVLQLVLEPTSAVADRIYRFAGRIERITEREGEVVYDCVDPRAMLMRTAFDKANTTQSRQAWVRELGTLTDYMGTGPGADTDGTTIAMTPRGRRTIDEVDDVLLHGSRYMTFDARKWRYAISTTFASSGQTIADSGGKVIKAGVVQDITELMNRQRGYVSTAAVGDRNDGTSQSSYGIRSAVGVRTRLAAADLAAVNDEKLLRNGVKIDNFWIDVADFWDVEPGTTAVVTLTPFGISAETCVCLAHEFRLGPTSPYYRLIFARSSTREKWPPKETGLLEAALKQAIGSNAQSANI